MTGTRFSRVLRAATQKKYTHVSISLDKELNELYSFGRRNQYLPFIAGFVKEHPDKGVFRKFPTECLIYEIEITDGEYSHLKDLLAVFMEDYRHYRYNFVALLLMSMNIPYNCKSHFVCSQFVAYLLTKSNVVDFNKAYSLVRPEDFYNIRFKHEIYEGLLRDYSRTVCRKPKKYITPLFG